MEQHTNDNALPVAERAIFIERMSAELARLAHGAGMELLSYLLEMARQEALLMSTVHGVAADDECDVAPVPRKRGRPIKLAMTASSRDRR